MSFTVTDDKLNPQMLFKDRLDDDGVDHELDHELNNELNDDMMDQKNFSFARSNDNDDILDEFLDQRVYDNVVDYTPEKLDFLEFYSPDNNFDVDNSHNYTANAINPNPNPYLNANHSSGSGFYDSGSMNNSPFKPNHRPFKSEVDSHASSLVPAHDLSSSNRKELNEYDSLREQVSHLKFGKYDMKVTTDSMHPDADLLDFSPETMNKLPYKLAVSELPTYSRVETQIKVTFNLNPCPPQNLLHIPQDLIAKNKFCLSEELNSLSPLILKNLLYMDCYVLTSNLEKSCNICSKCIKREQKRASRRRTGLDEVLDLPQISPNGVVKNNPNTWADEHMIKKAIMFNCKEIVSFPPPNGLNEEDKSIELCGRIICYCRHHQESSGFKLLFVIKDVNNNVVAKQLSSNIMIMDRKKSTGTSASSISNPTPVPSTTTHTPVPSNSSSNHHSHSNGHNPFIKRELSPGLEDLHPISPNSIDESSDLTTNESDRNLKRKKLSIDDSNNSTNPMYNGSINGFSPVSNSDTNTNTSSINNPAQFMPNPSHKPSSRIPDLLSTATAANNSLLSSNSLNAANNSLPNVPTILRIIPAQGPVRGGIEITLLGFNFNPNLAVKFGSNAALATHCWSETTIVTYLPPAAQPGQVLVTFETFENILTNQQQQIFTYTDDTDKQLIELALQIVGLKMNGKLEDAKNIAKRIVGNDNDSADGNGSTQGNATHGTNEAMEWFNNAQGIVEKLTKLNYSTEEVLVNFLKLVDLPNCPIIIPNWQLTNTEGQTLLHLSTIKNYKYLIKFLINHGCKIDLQDNQGLTPLFYAGINGQRDLMDLFISCKANLNLRLSNDKTLKDYCDLNVIDVLQESGGDNAGNVEGGSRNAKFDTSNSSNVIPDTRTTFERSSSIDSLNSMFEMKGLHISKMVPESMDNDAEFADSEYSEYDGYESSINDLRQSEEDVSSFGDEYEVEDEEFDNDDEGEETDHVRVDSHHDETTDDNRTSETETEASNEKSKGLWQKVKNVFNNSDDELPNYDELFPFGPSRGSRPKTTVERELNEKTMIDTAGSSAVVGSSSITDTAAAPASASASTEDKDKEDLSDSSEDMIISYINHPRKTVENDKMLIFFWVPILIMIISLFISISVIGYKFETIETVKKFLRDSLGNLMVGNERIKRVFRDRVNV